MRHLSRLKNTVQEYEWGSHTSIPILLGEKYPSDKPQAELWIGAHPKAPSSVYFNDQWVCLDKLVEAYPIEILGKDIAEKYENSLPYLLKVLAAEKPLSIQAHPDRKIAEIGFLRENRLNIPMNAFNRSYKDKNHKPECICAITPFWALNGFRSIDQILFYTEHLFPDALQGIRQPLFQQRDSKGLKQFFSGLLTMDQEKKDACIENAVSISEKWRDSSPLYDWIIRLYHEYPGDIGVLSPCFLNLVCLKPGQAMYLNAGELHAYLNGTGMELMANSDNVLRGGLTPKYVDIDELIKTLRFEERNLHILTPHRINETFSIYETPAEEFRLSLIKVKRGINYTGEKKRSVEIILCMEGEAVIGSIEASLKIKKGDSILVPAASPVYEISGAATLYKAAVPLSA